jgi:hypothetical protein
MPKNFQHIFPALPATNSKPHELKINQMEKKRNHFACSPFKMDSVTFKILIFYII